MKTRKDPVIDEIRAVRMEISAEFSHDIKKLCAFLRQEEQKHPERLATPAQLRGGKKTPTSRARDKAPHAH